MLRTKDANLDCFLKSRFNKWTIVFGLSIVTICDIYTGDV